MALHGFQSKGCSWDRFNKTCAYMISYVHTRTLQYMCKCDTIPLHHITLHCYTTIKPHIIIYYHMNYHRITISLRYFTITLYHSYTIGAAAPVAPAAPAVPAARQKAKFIKVQGRLGGAGQVISMGNMGWYMYIHTYKCIYIHTYMCVCL